MAAPAAACNGTDTSPSAPGTPQMFGLPRESPDRPARRAGPTTDPQGWRVGRGGSPRRFGEGRSVQRERAADGLWERPKQGAKKNTFSYGRPRPSFVSYPQRVVCEEPWDRILSTGAR
jgi:hypothetical protein